MKTKILLALALILLFSSCSKSSKEEAPTTPAALAPKPLDKPTPAKPILGQWERAGENVDPEDYLEFAESGDLTFMIETVQDGDTGRITERHRESATYTISGDTLKVIFQGIESEARVKVSEDELTIFSKPGGEEKFQRKK